MEWKQRLPEQIRLALESLLDSIQQYRSGYMEAENASVAQIWVALAHLNQRLDRVEEMARAQREVLKEMESDVNVDRKLDSNLQESLRRY